MTFPRPISRLALATSLAFGLAATTFAPAAMAETQEDSAPVTTTPAASDIKPPVAQKRPHTYTVHGITVEDPYDWLYDKSYPAVDDPDVLAHVKAEGIKNYSEQGYKVFRQRVFGISVKDAGDGHKASAKETATA